MMERSWISWASGCLVIFGCGSSRATPPPHQGGIAADPVGASAANPVMTCGPEDSYKYVAEKVHCPDGTNPFQGNIERARRSRRGSAEGQSNGHMIDVYEVPCTNKPLNVYVDLYGCPEYQERLAELEQPSPELTALTKNFGAGAFRKVLDRCESDVKLAVDERAYCLWLVPAALEALGSNVDALASAAKVCSGMPPAGPQSSARAEYAAMLLVTLSEAARAGHYGPTAEHRKSFLESLVAGCEVSSAEIGRIMNKLVESK